MLLSQSSNAINSVVLSLIFSFYHNFYFPPNLSSTRIFTLRTCLVDNFGQFASKHALRSICLYIIQIIKTFNRQALLSQNISTQMMYIFLITEKSEISWHGHQNIRNIKKCFLTIDLEKYFLINIISSFLTLITKYYWPF